MTAQTPQPPREQRIEEVGYDPAAVELEPVDACNLCRATRHVEVSRRDRYGYVTRFVVCAGCGLGFISPRPTASAYDRFYEGVYRPLISAYHGRRIDAEMVQDDQRGYAAELVDFLRHTLPEPPDRVLDVGGSTGVVAGAVCESLGARTATVLDPSPDELAHAKAAGMDTIQGFAEDLDVGDRRWELVLLCQTADHLLDPAATLAAIRGALAKGGHAFVDVLDVSWVLAKTGSIEASVKIDHPYYFTRATTLGLLRQAGLPVVGERMSDDGQWGFLVAGGNPSDPDFERLRASRDAFLADVWRRRAAGQNR